MESHGKAGLVCIGLTTVDIIAQPADSIAQNEGGVRISGIEIVPAGAAAGAALVAARLRVKPRSSALSATTVRTVCPDGA